MITLSEEQRERLRRLEETAPYLLAVIQENIALRSEIASFLSENSPLTN